MFQGKRGNVDIKLLKLRIIHARPMARATKKSNFSGTEKDTSAPLWVPLACPAVGVHQQTSDISTQATILDIDVLDKALGRKDV